MPFSSGSSVLPSHKHSSAVADGGVLDADVTEVDAATLDDYSILKILQWS